MQRKPATRSSFHVLSSFKSPPHFASPSTRTGNPFEHLYHVAHTRCGRAERACTHVCVPSVIVSIRWHHSIDCPVFIFVAAGLACSVPFGYQQVCDVEATHILHRECLHDISALAIKAIPVAVDGVNFAAVVEVHRPSMPKPM